MIVIKKITWASVLAIIFISACIEPNTEELWELEAIKTFETSGFCRSVDIHNDIAYLSAGQAGGQIWDLNSNQKIVELDQYSPSQDLSDISQVVFSPTVNKLFVLENNSRVVIMDLINGDSLVVLGEEMSEKTREIQILEKDSSSYIILAADNDDGLKWNQFDHDTTWNIWSNVAGDEYSTPGKPTGIAYLDGKIVMSVDQQGVELWNLDSLGSDPVFVNRLDTPGNAEKVTLTASGVFVACDDAGARYIPLEAFDQSSSRTDIEAPWTPRQFAQDLTVDHIANKGNIAILSIGSKGIAIYDISDPRSPESRGIFDIGYTYSATFWGEKLVVCTREGLKIFNINQ